MSAFSTTAELQAGVEKLTAEAQGALETIIVLPHEMPGLTAEAMLGDEEAAAILRVVVHVLGKVAGAPRHQPALCGACPRAVKRGKFAIAISKAMYGDLDGAQAITFAICARCGRDRPAAQAAANVALRRIWPALRPITVTHSEGGWA